MTNEKSINGGLKRYKCAIYIKNVGLIRLLYYMNLTYYKEVQKWGAREWKILQVRGQQESGFFPPQRSSSRFYNWLEKKKRIFTDSEKAIYVRSLELLAYLGLLHPFRRLLCRLTEMALYRQHLGRKLLSSELVNDIRQKVSVARHITSNYNSCLLVTLLHG